MHQLLLLASQLAGGVDVFTELLPAWALGEIYDNIMTSGEGDDGHLTRIGFQDWVQRERMPIKQKGVLAFFLQSSNGDDISRSEFIHVRNPLLQAAGTGAPL